MRTCDACKTREAVAELTVRVRAERSVLLRQAVADEVDAGCKEAYGSYFWDLCRECIPAHGTPRAVAALLAKEKKVRA